MSLVDNDSGVLLVLVEALGRINFDSVFGKVKVNYPNNRLIISKMQLIFSKTPFN